MSRICICALDAQKESRSEEELRNSRSVFCEIDHEADYENFSQPVNRLSGTRQIFSFWPMGSEIPFLLWGQIFDGIFEFAGFRTILTFLGR